ncbi:MAG: DUF3667 domain-containing protein, partial [Sphingomonas sp.]
MGEVEAAGEIVTGALLGRAVEPDAGEGGGRGEICLNCGTALLGAHCHRCGQSAHVHRSLGAIGHEILHGVVHFEGKLWRTLPLLARRPGQLTRRYIDGERARFVSPIALFLFSIFTLFAVFSLFGITPQQGGAVIKETPAQVRADLIATRDEAARQRKGLAAANPKARVLDQLVAGLDAQIKAAEAPGAGAAASGSPDDDFTFDSGWEPLDHGVAKALENPSLAAYKLQSNSYKFSWLLIPLSLPFVWLMFAGRREFHLYDHAVFVTYSIAFMSLLFIVTTVVAALGVPEGIVRLAAIVIVPVHIFSQLRGTYGLSRTGAALRTVVLLLFIMIVLMLFFAAILALGLLG